MEVIYMSFDMKKVKSAYKTFQKDVEAKAKTNQQKYIRYLNSSRFGDAIQKIVVNNAYLGITDVTIEVMYCEIENRITITFDETSSYSISDTSNFGTLGDISFYYNKLLEKLVQFGLKPLDKPIDEDKFVKYVRQKKPITLSFSCADAVKKG
jgi:hypothetical protein